MSDRIKKRLSFSVEEQRAVVWGTSGILEWSASDGVENPQPPPVKLQDPTAGATAAAADEQQQQQQQQQAAQPAAARVMDDADAAGSGSSGPFEFKQQAAEDTMASGPPSRMSMERSSGPPLE